MKITLYNFSKKQNSTKIVGNAGIETECTLKWEGCGIVNPRIDIDFGLENSPVSFNYAYIQAFERYYFVGDWVFNNGIWSAPLRCDVLASHRAAILNKSLYIVRTGVQFDSSIIDLERVGTARHSFRTSVTNFDNTYNPSNGVFIVGIAGKNTPNSIGSVQYYALSQSDMYQLISKMLYDTDWLNVDWEESKEFITNDILKCLINPIQYIIACHWIPWQPSGLATQGGQLPIGWWSVDIQNAAVVKAGTIVSKSYIVNIIQHPQADDVGYWLRLSPYSVYTLDVPMAGTIVIDAADILNRERIQIDYNLDVITGNCIINITAMETDTLQYSKLIRTINVDLSVKVPISQVNSDMISAAISIFNGSVDISSNLVGAIGSALSVGGAKGTGLSNITEPVAEVLNSAKTFVNTIGDATQALIPKIETVGGVGSWAKFRMSPHIILNCDFTLVTDLDPMTMGRPLCGVRRLGTLGGYTVCKTGDIEIDCFADEYTQIEHYLTTGFYVE